MLSGFWHEKNIIASMVHTCGIIRSNTKRQTHKLCKETPILHELKCDFSTNTLNIYYTYKMKSVSWNIDTICSSFMFQPRRKTNKKLCSKIKKYSFQCRQGNYDSSEYSNVIIPVEIYFTPCFKKQCFILWIKIELEIYFFCLMVSKLRIPLR